MIKYNCAEDIVIKAKDSRLTVLSIVREKGKYPMVVCMCSCGNVKTFYWAGFALVENDRIEGVCVFGQPSPPLQKFAFREADIDKIVALIQRGPQKEGGAELLVKQSCSRTLFNIPWKDVNGEGEGILLPCVFHTKCKMLCTVLPRNWRDTYENFVLDRDGNSWLHGERSDLSDDNLSDGADE